MADVVISYERGSEAVTKRVAARLTELGLSVWWDEQIPAHRVYAEMIEERLRAASAVIVLWSKAATKSQWVRAEANVAREAGKLIQAVLDGAAPPLPFDQIQHADLEGWSGQANHPGWRKIEASVRELVAQDAADSAPAAPPGAARTGRRRLIAATGLAAIVLAGMGTWALTHASGGDRKDLPKVSIAPVTTSDPALAGLAADIADAEAEQLNGLAPLTGAAASGKAAVRLEGRVEMQGDHVHATLKVLNGMDQAVLWTGGFDHAPGDAAGLPSEVSAKGADILWCALDSLDPKAHLTNVDRSIYLKICDLVRSSHAAEVSDLQRRLAQDAPQFYSHIQASRALSLALSLDLAPEAERPRLRVEAAAAAEKALAANPNVPFPYIAMSVVRSRNDWLGREQWLAKGVAIGPDGTLFNYYADFLMEVGRWREAMQFQRRAVELDPISQPKAGEMIEHLFLTGAVSEGKDRLAAARQTWADRMDPVVVQTTAFADPAEALRLMETLGPKAEVGDDQGVAAWRAFVQARQSRSPAAVAQASDLLGRALEDGHLDAGLGVRALLALGRTDVVQAYFRKRAARNDDIPTDALFSPEAARFRRDPAFMALANDIGLLRYWKTSGKWPDFCAAPDLPYRCQALAR